MATHQQIEHTDGKLALGAESVALLKELEHTPQVVGYDKRIAALDNAHLIQWQPGWGYIASDAGREFLATIAP